MEIKFGIFDHLERRDVPLEQLYEERLRLLEAADAAGIYCYHLAEHHCTPLGCAPSPGVFLAAVAARTRRIHLGPLVYLLPLYNPLRLVEEICMLDQLSGGRFEIGVGRGISPFELGYFNVNFLEAREWFEESLQVIVAGLREPKLAHKGAHYRYASAPLEIHPKQKPNPPFWYGTSNPEGLAFAARHGMNIVAGGPNAVVNGVAQAYQQLRGKFRGENIPDSRDNLNPQVTVPIVGAVRHFFLADTDREAEQIARPAYKIYYDNIVKLWRDHGTIPSMFTDDLDRASNADAAIVGSPATVRERIARYFEQTSCNYLVLSFAWGNLTHEQSLKSLNLFASKVMPEFVGRA